MATLLNQVRGITNSSTNESSDTQVVDFVKAGVRFVLNSLPTALIAHLSTLTASVADGNGITVGTNRLLSVKRNGIKCIEVPSDMSYDIGDSNSIHLATARFPSFWSESGKVYIKPNPAGGAVGIAEIINIDERADVVVSSTTDAIGQFDSPVVKYAASLDANKLAGYYAEQGSTMISAADISSSLSNFVSALPTFSTQSFTFDTTEIDDALTNAKDLIDNKADYDAEDFLGDEDAEMVASAVQTAAQEIGRANAAIQNELAQIKDFDSKVAQEVQRFQGELTKAKMYLEEAQVKISNAQLAQQYTEYVAQYSNMARALYQECMNEINAYKSTMSVTDDATRNNGEGRVQTA